MGIHDRDYARNDGRSVFDGFTGRTQVCLALVAVNIFCYLVQLATRERLPVAYGPGGFTDALSLDGGKILHGEFWRLLTYAFLHDFRPEGLMHVVFNLAFLWWFGSQLEDLSSSKEFLCFYLFAAVVTGLGYLGGQTLEGREAVRAIGASGAVTAVMVAYATRYPTRIFSIFGLLPVPVWCFVIFQAMNDSLGLLGGSREPIALAAHLSGAVFGGLYVLLHWRVSALLPPYGMRKPVARPNAKPVKIFTEIVPDEEEEVAQPASPVPVVPAVSAARTAPIGDRSKLDEQLEAKVDEVLEKVTKFGQSSLTEGERELLMRASEIYRKKKNR